MKRKSTLVDSVSAEPEVSAVGRKRLSLTVIPQNKANRLRNVSSEPVYAAPLARRSQSPARRSQSPTRRRATFNSSLLTVLTVLLCLFFGGKAWGQVTLWSENFEGGSMPSGWTTDGNGSWSVATAVNSSYPSSAGQGTYCAQIKHGTTGNATKLITPTIDLSSVTSAELSFMHAEQSWAGDIDGLKVYCRTSTSGTWIQLEEYTNAYASWTTEEGIALPNLSSTYQLAFEYIDNWGYGLGIDDIKIVQSSSCPKPTALSATTNVQNATITWIGSAGSYDIARSTNASASPDDCVVATGVSSNSYDFSSLSLADHYVWVRADCGGNGKSNWTAPVSFHIGYCNPAPTSIDNSGVTNVTFGTGSNVVNNNTHPASAPFYGDYTAQIGAVEAGVQASMSITYATGYTYNTYVWVDLNNNLTFEASEVVCYGESTSNNPTTLTLNFTIPANQAAGDYRMRIGGADSGLGSDPNNADPCYSSSWAVFEDYTLRVLSLTCPAPTGLTAGTPTANSVQLSWTAGGSEPSWQICVNGDEGNLVSANSNSFNLTGLYPETTYTVKVRAYCDANDQSAWSNMVTFTTEASACPKPTNVTAGNLTHSSAQITWDGNADSYTVRYRTATITGTTLDPVFEDGFESGLGDWTTYVNGYASTWPDNSFIITDWHQDNNYTHTGSYAALSRSYGGGDIGDVSVDNWLVSPQMTLGDVVKFWVLGDDAGWQEYYSVYVSTETNAVSDFRLVDNPELAPGDGTWAERTVDISAYAGQTGYVAIRHTDTGKDYLFVDDFGVYNTVNAYSYGTATTITPATSPYTITGLSAETLYEVSVQSDCGDPDGISGWSSIYFTTPDACAAPTDLVSSNITSTTATLGWADNQDSYNLRYRKVYFYEGFEGETLPTGWTTIDANDDGNTWSIGHATAHSGNNGAYNLSYNYLISGITPDDWLVSPQLDLQGTLRVWLSGYARQGSSYSEHFQIYVSTTGNSVSDFTTTLVAETTTGDTYVEYTADLSSYAGQQGYIAIHHFNCTDQYYLYVDDFGLYGSDNWVSVSPNPTDATATLTGLSADTEYEWQVQGIDCDGVGGTTNWSAPSNFTTLYPTKIRNTNPAADEMTWEQFAGYVNGGHSYSGETVTLMENISVSDMVGTSSHPFSGTFEGDGKTITANISSSEQGAAPFRYISDATIQNLKVDGTVTSTAHHASGLVGFCADGSTNTIQNCHISTNVTNNNAYNGDSGSNYMGGIVGHNKGATTSIIGCVYDGTLTSQGFKGGMIGFADPPSPYTATVYITITDSYFAGSYSANGYGDPNFSPVAVRAGHGFIFDLTSSNFYYNTDAGDFTATQYSFESNSNKDIHGTCKHAYTVTGESPVTVAMNGTPTTYNVSGITAYSTGIVYNGTIYGGDGDVLALSLDGSSCGYETDHGSIIGSGNPYSLTMEAYNTVISAPVYTVTVNVNADEGGTASGSGSYICGATATLEATANTGYHFVNWTKNSTEVSTSATYNFTVTEAADYVANFEINTYTVTTVIHPTEGGSAEGAGTYTHGSSCTLEATANTGYQFVNWTASNGSVVSANRSYTFTVTGDVTYQANFTKTTVTSLPWTENFDNGYSCANGWTYLHGEWATPLRWTKAACVTYYSWGAYSDPYCMELRANNSDNLVVLPQFDEPLNKLKIKFQIGRGNEASGYTVQLGYVTDPSDASTFTALDNIATPSSGVNHFDLYTYDLSTNNNSPSSSAYRLAIKYTKSGEDSWYLDDFDVRRVYTIAVSDNPSSTASSLTGAGKYDHGATCTVTATAGDCYNFVNWTENGTEVSTSASYSFTATADRNLVANFEEWTLSLGNTPASLECINSETEVVLTATATSDATPTYAWEVSSGSTAGTASGYTYTVSPTALSNTYTVSATIGGCERTQSATITTKPVITSVSSSAGNEFCLGVSTDLSVESNASSFTWDNDAGSGSPVTVTPTATKTYKVSATSGSCVSTSSITITVNTPDITDYDYIWRGVSDDWNTAGNWYMYNSGSGTFSVPSTLPSEAKNYYIGTGTTCLPSSQWPTLSGDAIVNNITISSGTVTVDANKTLSIAGSISGTITAESGSTIEFVGSSDQTINDSQTFSNVTFSKDGANEITATGGLIVNGTATFTKGIVTGNVTFGSGATVSGASTSSYVNGKVTRNGMIDAFTFPTGTATLYAPFKATSSSASNVSVQYAAGHDGMPDWWNHSGNLYDAGLNHASDRENWQLSASASTELSSIILYWNESDNHSFEEGNEALNSYLNVAAVKRNGFNWQNLGRASIEGDYDGSGSITAAEPLVIEISGAKAAGEGDYFVTFASSNNNLVLPIELTSFTATCDGRSALVEWSTASERNNDYFSLERSDDAINFVEIVRIAGAGNSIDPVDYAYNDYGIYGGDNYYRLVQVDYDGTRTVSEVIVANCIEPESDGEPEVLAYPNPFSSELTVVLDNFGNRAATIEVYDMLGKLIYTNKISAPQNSYETILNLSNLPPAAYTVRVSTNDFVINRNVVKQ